MLNLIEELEIRLKEERAAVDFSSFARYYNNDKRKKFVEIYPVGTIYGDREILSSPFKVGKYYKVQTRCKCGIIKNVSTTDIRAEKSKLCAKCSTSSNALRCFFIGQIINNHIILNVAIKRKKNIYCELRCLICGRITFKKNTDLNMGRRLNCHSCKKKLDIFKDMKLSSQRNSTNHPLYIIWQGMFARCYNPKSRNFHSYGGRGIEVCVEWRNFETFYTEMGERPDKYQLHRIEHSGNYELKNCKWVSARENSNNTRLSLKNRNLYDIYDKRQIKEMEDKIKDLEEQLKKSDNNVE